VVPPASDQVLRAWPYSGTHRDARFRPYPTVTVCGAVFQTASGEENEALAGVRQDAVVSPPTPSAQGLPP
jgi:hypothetical protein